MVSGLVEVPDRSFCPPACFVSMTAASLPPPARLPWWRWINLLALDAVAVALVWQRVFAEMAGTRVERVEMAALGVAVWAVYGADRLLDSRLPPDEHAFQERHRFAARQARWLIPLTLLLLSLVLWWSLYAMRQSVLFEGVHLAVLVGVYFGILAFSRWGVTSMTVLLGLTPILAGVLLAPLLIDAGLAVRGQAGGEVSVQWWRAAAAALLVLVPFSGFLKGGGAGTRPPWTLFRKVMGGFLFARGVALAPLMHFERGAESLWSAPVMLLAGACAMNSLGIRLWEYRERMDLENQRLRRFYPWIGVVVGCGALSEAVVADDWTRPVLLATAACAAGLTALNALRSRLSAPVMLALADGMVLAAGVGALIMLSFL